MPGSTLTSKGQVTIPKPVREALGVHAGDRISFVVRDDGVVELRPETVDLRELFGVLDARGKKVTVEEMGEAVAEAAEGAFGKSDGR